MTDVTGCSALDAAWIMFGFRRAGDEIGCAQTYQSVLKQDSAEDENYSARVADIFRQWCKIGKVAESLPNVELVIGQRREIPLWLREMRM